MRVILLLTVALTHFVTAAQAGDEEVLLYLKLVILPALDSKLDLSILYFSFLSQNKRIKSNVIISYFPPILNLF